ncbi:hypothetical protein BDK51DRAFT_32362 [Blyttiomyces helicus]|uniref:Uncharacterized protein n=1 Tax=Blyttiomyces helicus TaxID=388810 RepID=A0A4P9WRU7_9FUNG|nr:hypothetical protein BDK51DRAFT_32362 [Blyttiomyces helicus]|eukprot:RKO94638.1 hypothetical protein BDK51DRAFT_32362 [Blyttiomyces helicus]
MRDRWDKTIIKNHPLVLHEGTFFDTMGWEEEMIVFGSKQTNGTKWFPLEDIARVYGGTKNGHRCLGRSSDYSAQAQFCSHMASPQANFNCRKCFAWSNQGSNNETFLANVHEEPQRVAHYNLSGWPAPSPSGAGVKEWARSSVGIWGSYLTRSKFPLCHAAVVSPSFLRVDVISSGLRNQVGGQCHESWCVPLSGGTAHFPLPPSVYLSSTQFQQFMTAIGITAPEVAPAANPANDNKRNSDSLEKAMFLYRGDDRPAETFNSYSTTFHGGEEALALSPLPGQTGEGVGSEEVSGRHRPRPSAVAMTVNHIDFDHTGLPDGTPWTLKDFAKANFVNSFTSISVFDGKISDMNQAFRDGIEKIRLAKEYLEVDLDSLMTHILNTCVNSQVVEPEGYSNKVVDCVFKRQDFAEKVLHIKGDQKTDDKKAGGGKAPKHKQPAKQVSFHCPQAIRFSGPFEYPVLDVLRVGPHLPELPPEAATESAGPEPCPGRLRGGQGRQNGWLGGRGGGVGGFGGGGAGYQGDGAGNQGGYGGGGGYENQESNRGYQGDGGNQGGYGGRGGYNGGRGGFNSGNSGLGNAGNAGNLYQTFTQNYGGNYGGLPYLRPPFQNQTWQNPKSNPNFKPMNNPNVFNANAQLAPKHGGNNDRWNQNI